MRARRLCPRRLEQPADLLAALWLDESAILRRTHDEAVPKLCTRAQQLVDVRPAITHPYPAHGIRVRCRADALARPLPELRLARAELTCLPCIVSFADGSRLPDIILLEGCARRGALAGGVGR